MSLKVFPKQDLVVSSVYLLLPVCSLSNILQPFYASVPIYNASLTCTKVSILLQYLRFFVTKTARRACWAVMAIVGSYGLVALFGTCFMCVPVSYFWNKTISGHCMNAMAFWFTNAAMNIATDLTILILPMPVLYNLNLPTKQKRLLMGVFAFGIL